MKININLYHQVLYCLMSFRSTTTGDVFLFLQVHCDGDIHRHFTLTNVAVPGTYFQRIVRDRGSPGPINKLYVQK